MPSHDDSGGHDFPSADDNPDTKKLPLKFELPPKREGPPLILHGSPPPAPVPPGNEVRLTAKDSRHDPIASSGSAPTRRKRRSKHSFGKEPGTVDPLRKKRSRTSPRAMLLASLLLLGVALAAGIYLARQPLSPPLPSTRSTPPEATQPSASPDPTEPAAEPAAKPADEKPLLPTEVGPQQNLDKLATLIDDAFETYLQGDLQRAADRFREAGAMAPDLPGLTYQLARVLFRQGDFAGALREIDTAIASEKADADLLMLRGQVLTALGTYSAAHPAYEAAAQIDPFRPYVYFYWGEALRDAGKPREAVERLEQAYRRAFEQPDAFVIQLKLFLARVEAGDANFLNNELAPELAKENPGIQYLLAAGASALDRGDWSGAADFFARAKRGLPPAFYHLVVADKYFDLHRARPGLTELLDTRVP